MRGSYLLGGALVFAVLSGAALGAAVGWVFRNGPEVDRDPDELG